MNAFNTLSIDSKFEIAGQMVIMDAMQKGYTNKDGLIKYMQSDTFKAAVMRYVEMMGQ